MHSLASRNARILKTQLTALIFDPSSDNFWLPLDIVKLGCCLATARQQQPVNMKLHEPCMSPFIMSFQSKLHKNDFKKQYRPVQNTQKLKMQKNRPE